MNTRTTLTLIFLGLVVFWTGFIWLGIRLVPTERKIDCSLAEISPDYTQKMKDQCRKVRA